ncbi:MAG: PKD domain-containing protein [Bacteroidetes bacterium]|nr:PKD domain-containing protein [Bacteroidota bacterium]
MKLLYSIAVLLLISASGCQKNSPATDNNDSNGYTSGSSNSIPKPSANFRIANIRNNIYVVEGKDLKLQNLSTNATSFHWDFGNGLTSDDQVPTKIAYVPCGSEYNITLTTKNSKGESATVTKTIKVLCSGKNTHGTYITGE